MPHFLVSVDLNAHESSALAYHMLDEALLNLGCLRRIAIDGVPKALPPGQYYTKSDAPLAIGVVLRGIETVVDDLFGAAPSILVTEITRAASRGLSSIA